MRASSNPDSIHWPASTVDAPATHLYTRGDLPDTARIVMLTGGIDLSALPELRACLAPLAGHVIVDLYGVSFLDASGIGVLVGARKALGGTGGDLMLRSPTS